jgi:UDP-GlcNAc:undecaprenyl-phosphate GlcNAc-1-phosphate transferase
MVPVTPNNLIPPLVSFALAVALTPVVKVLARRWGFIARPKTDRWHKKPTAMMGGVAIWLAVMLTIVAAAAVESYRS